MDVKKTRRKLVGDVITAIWDGKSRWSVARWREAVQRQKHAKEYRAARWLRMPDNIISRVDGSAGLKLEQPRLRAETRMNAQTHGATRRLVPHASHRHANAFPPTAYSYSSRFCVSHATSAYPLNAHHRAFLPPFSFPFQNDMRQFNDI